MEKLYISGAMSSVTEGIGHEVSKNIRDRLNKIGRMRHLVWLEDYIAALEQAAGKTGSEANGAHLVMAVFTGSDWCQYCMNFQKEILQSQIFLDWFNMHEIVPLLVDYPHHSTQSSELEEQNGKLFMEYNIQVFPTVITIKALGCYCLPSGKCIVETKEVSRICGYLKGTDVNTWIANYSDMANLK